MAPASTQRCRFPWAAARIAGTKLDFGYQYQDRERVSNYRRFGFATSSSYGQATPPESIYAAGQWGNPFLGAQMSEGTFDNDSYEASQVVRAAFVSADLGVTRRLRAILGVRYEDGTQYVRTYDYFTNATYYDGATNRLSMAQLDDQDFLPSANLVYQLNDRTNLRLAASRTLSRPDIRELSTGLQLDMLGGYAYRGNADLVRASILNYDLRAEMFATANEVFAASFFYKDFTDPIENAILPSDQLLVSPINSEGGRNLGLELETRVNMTRLSGALDGFSFNLNASLIDSEIDLGQGVGSRIHPLQGQSNYLLNVGLGYVSSRGRWDTTVLVNRVGRRLANLGYPPNEDIYERAVDDRGPGRQLPPVGELAVQADRGQPVRRQLREHPGREGLALRQARPHREPVAELRIVRTRGIGGEPLRAGLLALVAALSIAAAAPAPAPRPHTATSAADSLADHELQQVADSIRAARIRQGWYPPADPESASVRIGRRDAPLVAMTFSGGRRSLAALGRAIVSNVSDNAPDSLLALCITKQEFETILWPEFPQSRPATGLLPMDGWRVLNNRLVSGTRGAAADWGGQPWTFVRIEASAGVQKFRNFDLHRGIVIVVKDAAGTEQRLDFLRTVAERKGVFKIYSVRD